MTTQRSADDRFVGVCRDFSLLHCSFLRHAGIPARIRYGFADYLGPDDFHTDHVVTEHWDDERGRLLADPQLADPVVCSMPDCAASPSTRLHPIVSTRGPSSVTATVCSQCAARVPSAVSRVQPSGAVT
ncbi:transglutaminase-like domain-containing protein [Kitasatospora acidiphila]|uniref:transglutaminase-like domain-containing protein n=1 Tax=Kitasatospora acidiphila TaxID=2567942 RepID=UPI003C74DA61